MRWGGSNNNTALTRWNGYVVEGRGAANEQTEERRGNGAGAGVGGDGPSKHANANDAAVSSKLRPLLPPADPWKIGLC